MSSSSPSLSILSMTLLRYSRSTVNKLAPHPIGWKFLTGPKEQVDTVGHERLSPGAGQRNRPARRSIQRALCWWTAMVGCAVFLMAAILSYAQKLLMDIGDLLREAPSVGKELRLCRAR